MSGKNAALMPNLQECVRDSPHSKPFTYLELFRQVGIERWTDGSFSFALNYRCADHATGIRWGPSRVREGFLFYHEKSQQSYADHLYGGEKLCVPPFKRLLRHQS